MFESSDPAGDEAWVDRECPFDDVDDQDVPPLPEDVEFAWPSAGEWLASACGQVPGVGLLDSLDQIAVDDLDANDAITYLQQRQRAVSWLTGVETRDRARVTVKVVHEVQAILAADAVAGRPEYVCPEQVAYSEITAALRWSPVTGARLVVLVDLISHSRMGID